MYMHNNGGEKKVRNKEKGSVGQLSNIIVGLIRKDNDFEFF